MADKDIEYVIRLSVTSIGIFRTGMSEPREMPLQRDVIVREVRPGINNPSDAEKLLDLMVAAALEGGADA